MVRDKKPGHAPMDDFVLAVRAVRSAWDAFSSYQTDIAKAKVDMRVMTPRTTKLLKEADQARTELYRILEIAAAEIRKQEGETH